MSLFHYYIVELDLPEVVGTCTINGNPGYSTPLTCSDQASPTTTTKTHKFTDTGLILSESDIHKCVTRVTETPPKLKAGNGIASRASCTINLRDFIGDPNPGSPALSASPAIADQGTFFGKLKQRNILANKKVRVLHYESDGQSSTLIRTNHYIATDIKRDGQNWVLQCKDVLYRADSEKSQYPPVVDAKLFGDIAAGTTSIVISGNISDWTPSSNYYAVIGKDLLPITAASGNASQVTLTVARESSITLGSRTILNEPSDHSDGDEVFRGRKFVNADLYDVIIDVFDASGISAADYDFSQIAGELNSWLGSVDNSIDCVFYEPQSAERVLNDICQHFLLDIWTDTQAGKVKLKATSPWNETVSVLTEGVEIIYGTVSIDEPRELHHSRAYLQYDKRRLTDNDDSTSFSRSSLAFNTDLEGALYYDQEKLKKLGKSIILSDKTNNIETADLTTVRYAQRFSNRPQEIKFEVDEQDVDFALGDVIEVVTADNQDFAGNPLQGIRAQVTQLTPTYKTGRVYKVTTTTYNPYIGGIAGSDITVNSQFDINLFTQAGGPVSADTYTFLFDGQNYGQNNLSQAITVGSFPSGSVVNIVCLNGAIITGRGGDGGAGDDVDFNGNSGAGQSGGIALKGTSGTTVNVYLGGDTGDLGNGAYTADGYLYAPGGGGAGGSISDIGGRLVGGAGGGGGSGFPAGVGGQGGSALQPQDNGYPGQDGTASSGGNGGPGVDESGGNGGFSAAGQSTAYASGGTSGSALDRNGSTVNIYTSGSTSRFKQGAGDAPNSLT